jgi:thiol peroxidase
MATITISGNTIHTSGELPATGSMAPDFKLVKSDLSEFSLSELKGKKVMLNIFPSLGTGVCSASVRKFNEKAAGLENTVVLAISKDLPFAAKEFCTTNGIENVITLSVFRHPDFGKNYGVDILDGPFAGLLARCVIIHYETGKVIYSEQVPEIGQEPDYEKALAAI